MKKGERVLVTGGSWAGYSGEYAGVENTPIGEMHKVILDIGASTLVTLNQIKSNDKSRRSRKNKRDGE